MTRRRYVPSELAELYGPDALDRDEQAAADLAADFSA